MEQKERILNEVAQLYMQFGVRSITMDDVASKLGVSKKTIYQHFKDKDDLVHQFVELRIMAEEAICIAFKKSENAIEEIQKVAVYMKEHIANMNPSLLFDIQKYHPVAYRLYEEFKNNYMFAMVKDNLIRGVEDGHYREGIDVEILAKLKLMEIQAAFDPVIFDPAKFKMYDVHMQLFEHFLMGVITNKGLTLLNKYRENNEEA